MSQASRGRAVSLFSLFFLVSLLAAGLAWADPVGVDPLGGTSAPNQGNQEINDAVTRVRNQDFDGALTLLKSAVSKNPDLPPAQVIMAQLFAQANQAQGARNALERAVVESPKDPEAYVLLGDIALRDRGVTEACLLFEKANELLPNLKDSPKRKKILAPRVLAGLTSVAEAREDWPGAMKQLEAWAKLEPENANVLQRIARALFQLKKQDEALAKLKEAVKLDKNIITPEAQIAQWYEATGDREKATSMMIAALKEAPKDLRTRLAAAQWSLQTDQLDQAREQAASALQIDPNSLDAKLMRGLVAMFQRDYKAAELHFESALLQAPDNFAASNNLALALADQDEENKKRRALAYAQVNVRQFPRQAEAHSTLGWVLYRLGRLDEAEQSLRTAVSGGTLSADTAYYLARVAVDRNRKDEARNLLETALRFKGPFLLRKEAQVLLDQLK